MKIPTRKAITPITRITTAKVRRKSFMLSPNIFTSRINRFKR
jgi:hypothetical protein